MSDPKAEAHGRNYGFGPARTHEPLCVDQESTPELELEVVCEDGYPTPDSLEELRRAADQALTWQVQVRVCECVCEALEATGYGTIRKLADDRGVTYHLVTGGWSGCEDVIAAIEGTLLWACCWESSHRGGLFVLRVEVRA